MKLEEIINPVWVCVDDNFCTEFGVTVTDCIERYQESMGELDIRKLTFYELQDPYVVEPFYSLRRKNPIES